MWQLRILRPDPYKNVNHKMLDHILAEETVCKSVDTVASQVPVWHTLKSFSAARYQLNASSWAVIMLLQNVMLSQGLFNGIKLTANAFTKSCHRSLFYCTSLIQICLLNSKETVSYVFSLFSGHQQVKRTEIYKILLVQLLKLVFSHTQVYIVLWRDWAKWCLSEMNKGVNCVYNEIYE